MNRLFSVLALAAVLVIARADDDVVVGNKDNFESLISKDELTLVKFYAPWCGHCKKMAPDFKEAATELKGRATLVDLDATVEKDLAQKYEIRGFPTLKLFQKGEVVSDYKGGRTKDAIVKFIERSMLPSITEIADAEAVAEFVKEHAGKAIYFGVDLSEKIGSAYKKISMSLRDVIPDAIAFASVKDATLLKELAKKDVDTDSVLLVRDDQSTESFSDKPEALEAWAKMGSLPLFTELSRENAAMYTELDKPTFMLFQDPEKKDEEVNKIVTDVAKEHRSAGIMAFTWINSVELKSFAEHIGVADKSPALAIYDFKSDVKYAFDGEFSAETFGKWVQDYADGKLEPTKKSQDIPEKNDEPVKVVVGHSWEQIVEDESKDVLIEQYAPWCGHCKKLAPILDELAAELKGVETLVIAKMDATMNDAPADYKAQGYPTLHFFPAGSKKGIQYQGGREKKDFIKFFKENCTHKEGIELPEEEEASEDKDKEEEGEKEKEEL